MDSVALGEYLAQIAKPASSQTLGVKLLSRTRRVRNELRRLAFDSAARFTGTRYVIVDVPDFGGTFELDVRSHLFRSVVSRNFEAPLARLVARLVEPGEDVVDIGANVGLFTVLLGRSVGSGRVLAVEPHPEARAMLLRNINRNSIKNVNVFAGAASNHDAGVVLHSSAGFSEYASLGGSHHPNAPTTDVREIEVPSKTLDQLTTEEGIHPSFIKIDVEGAEGLVLRGGENVLNKYRPVLLAELDDRLLSPLGDDARTVINLLNTAGYRVFDAYSGAELNRSQGDSPIEQFVGEILALPKEVQIPT